MTGSYLRAARPDDVEQVVALNGEMHAEPGTTGPDEWIIEWTRDLFDLAHPTFRLDDTTVVEDAATGQIVSTVFTIPQWWSYAGTPLLVGRPELVATVPAYRRRGLIRGTVRRDPPTRATALARCCRGVRSRAFRGTTASSGTTTPCSTSRRIPRFVRVAQQLVSDPRWSVRPATSDDVVAFLAKVDAATAARSSFFRCVPRRGHVAPRVGPPARRGPWLWRLRHRTT